MFKKFAETLPKYILQGVFFGTIVLGPYIFYEYVTVPRREHISEVVTGTKRPEPPTVKLPQHALQVQVSISRRSQALLICVGARGSDYRFSTLTELFTTHDT